MNTFTNTPVHEHPHGTEGHRKQTVNKHSQTHMSTAVQTSWAAALEGPAAAAEVDGAEEDAEQVH